MDAPPPDEELPGQDRPGPTRRTRGLLAVAVLVAVVGAIAVAVHRSDPHRDVARPTLSAPTAPSTPIPTASVTSPPPPPCLDVGGSRLNCGVSPTLPTSTLSALQTVLPGASVVVASTVVGRNGRVYSRRATVRGPDASTLQLTLGPPTGEPAASSVLDASSGAGLTYAADIARHHVQLTIRGTPPSSAPTVAALRRLAADPRLTAL